MEKPLAENRSQTSVEEDQTAAKDRRAKGEFVRGASGFRHAVGDENFPTAPNRPRWEAIFVIAPIRGLHSHILLSAKALEIDQLADNRSQSFLRA